MNRRLGPVLPHILIGGTIIAIATGVVAMRVTGAGRGPYVFLNNLTYWMLWTALAPAAIALGLRVRIVAGRYARSLLIHAIASVVFAAVHLAVVTTFAAALRAWFDGVPLAAAVAEIRVPMRIHVEWEITMYWALVGLAHAIAFRQDAQERELRAAQLESRLAQAQLQALQRQLQPHFLFNSLHTISALVHRDVNAADAMIERLGDLLRMTLSAGDDAEVTLARELEHVRHYVAIEQANMGSRLVVAVDAEPAALSAGVPALLLQPLVENSVRHGLAPRAEGGEVRIVARRDGAFLDLTVQDDGVGIREGARRAGIGLENTRQRLQQLYGEAHSFSVESRDSGGVAVSIRVPFHVVGDREPREAWQ
ncbi:MAG TPA: histidine kinase [Vicinamibacterales bacterium]